MRLAGLWSRLCCVVFLMCSMAPAHADPASFALRSISFPIIGSTYLDDIAGWVPVAESIQQMKALGANDVKITISAGEYTSPLANLPKPDNGTLNPSDEKMLALFHDLKAAGFQITLQPFVNVDFDPNGNLLDSVHPQPTDFGVWMNAHTEAMVRWARLAQQAGVERFTVIGDETQGLAYGPDHTAGWLDMIARVRQVYSGQVITEIYLDGTIFGGGANHVDLIDKPVLDAVDVIGIAWYPLPITSYEQPTQAQLVAGWRHTAHNGADTVAVFTGLHERYGKPIFIADLAFHSFTGDNVRGGDIYNAAISLVANPQAQVDEYETLLSVLSANLGSWFLGVSCDSWSRFPLDYRLTARFLSSEFGENLRGKPAADTLREWFTGQRGWAGMKATADVSGTNANMVLSANLTVAPVDLGKSGNLYVAAVLPNGKIYAFSNGVWTLYTSGAIPAYAATTLGTHFIPLFTGMDVRAFSGTYILVGYGTDQSDLLANRKYVAAYVVQ